MGKSAFNKLAETTDGDDMDEIALKLKAMLKGVQGDSYRSHYRC